MGTLFDQRPRQETIDSYISTVLRTIDQMELLEFGEPYSKLSPEMIMAACKVAETALKIQSADVLDEQLAGFGEILKEFSMHLEKNE